MLSPTFRAHYPWTRPGAPATNRPYAEVHLQGPSGRKRVFCLVDSGADRLLVDAAFAGALGLALRSGTPIRSLTAAGGTFTMTEVGGVDVTVEGTRKTGQKVRFATSAPPLLGRVTFLDFFGDVGFDGSGWQHT